MSARLCVEGVRIDGIIIIIIFVFQLYAVYFDYCTESTGKEHQESEINDILLSYLVQRRARPRGFEFSFLCFP